MDAAFHLSAASPCRGAGNSLYASGTDLDGEEWNSPPSMGAYEVYDADFIGALSVAIQSSQTTLLVNRSLALTGQITGRASGLEWSFGDGTIVTNVSYFTSYLWTSPGDYDVIFTAYNTDNPGGVSTNLLVQVLPWSRLCCSPLHFPCRPPMAFNSSSMDSPMPVTRCKWPPISIHPLFGRTCKPSRAPVAWFKLRMRTQPM